MGRQHQFRRYTTSSKPPVKHTYSKAHRKHTYFHGEQMRQRYCQPTGTKARNGQPIRRTIHDVLRELDAIYDKSDPDTSHSQLAHACQTAEALKDLLDPDDNTKLKDDISVKDLFSTKEWDALPAQTQRRYENKMLHELYPEITDWSWLPLIGFIHDMGKVLASPQWGSLSQWSVVGDTFPVGAPFSSSNVFYTQGFFKSNPDLTVTNTRRDYVGRYKKHCGFDNVFMSFGHDEYMYAVLNRTHHHLPAHALYIVRYHSFYPWHTPKNGERGYEDLANRQDRDMLPLLKAFQPADLHTKQRAIPDIEALRSYCDALIDKWIPGRANSTYALRAPKITW